MINTISKKQTSIIINKKAFFNYSIEKEYIGGIVLEGWEVKSIKAHKVQIADSYVCHRKNELWWVGAVVDPGFFCFQKHTVFKNRPRKLLMQNYEIRQISSKIQERGFAAVAIEIFVKSNFLKLRFALAQRKKTYDKRSTIKEREIKSQVINKSKLAWQNNDK
jgi:SsrA-binding protein